MTIALIFTPSKQKLGDNVLRNPHFNFPNNCEFLMSVYCKNRGKTEKTKKMPKIAKNAKNAKNAKKASGKIRESIFNLF